MFVVGYNCHWTKGNQNRIQLSILTIKAGQGSINEWRTIRSLSLQYLAQWSMAMAVAKL